MAAQTFPAAADALTVFGRARVDHLGFLSTAIGTFHVLFLLNLCGNFASGLFAGLGAALAPQHPCRGGDAQRSVHAADHAHHQREGKGKDAVLHDL